VANGSIGNIRQSLLIEGSHRKRELIIIIPSFDP
jgi:hypothetical protein